MNVQELATAVQYDLPVIVAILNNYSLGMVRQWQQFFFDGRYADTSLGRIEYENPFRTNEYSNLRKDYGASAMSHIADFALAVRGVQQSEFDEEDALMSLMMNMACDLSAQNEGQRIALPLADEATADAPQHQSLTKQYGIDPMDVEGMMSVNYAQP